jgi:SAM-dependent methyltransferase
MNMVKNSDVWKFLKSVSPGLRSRLLNESDPGRLVSLMQFERFLGDKPRHKRKIAVVSGSMLELELCLIGPDAVVTFLNFEDNPNLYDLNKDWSLPDLRDHHNTYDLVLCEQVLEHVLNPKRAIENLSAILKPGGLLHITVPAINNSHGEPFYFYAGFPAKTLAEFARGAGLAVLECSSWMSDKGSRMYSTCDWAPISQSGSISLMIHGLWASRNDWGAFLRILLGRIRNFARYPFQRLLMTKNTKNAVTTWLWAEKFSH